MKPAGIILSAGASSRMGTPKALLEYNGQTFLDCWISAFAAVCDPVIVVLGYEAERIRAGLARRAEATLVVNPEPARGMLSSLQCGLQAVPPAVPAVLFTPVDRPAPQTATLQAIVAAFASGVAPIVIPMHNEERGHPVAISRSIASEILALHPPSAPNQVIRAHHSHTCFLRVSDPAVTSDINEPAAYAALRAASVAAE